MTDPTRPTGDTADSDVADSEVAGYLANVAPETRAEIEAAMADGMPEWQALGCARRSCSDQHSHRFGDCALGDEPPPDDRTPIFRKFVAEDGLPSMAMVYTHLHWGEGVSSDATRTDREIGIPVCDDDGRELGEMRMSYANGRVLMVMLADAVTDAYEPSSEWLERRPYDELDDDMVDDLYDRLECAQQTIAAYQLREQPETWEQQATVIARQAVEIGELREQLARQAPAFVVDTTRDRPEQYDGKEWLDLRKAVERLAAANAAIGRVRALADALRAEGEPADHDHAVRRINAAARILAALDGDTPKEPK